MRRAKETAKSKGGSIRHEYTLIKGFTYTCSSLVYTITRMLTRDRVEFPNDTVHTLETNEHIHVEQDGEAKAQ